MKKILLMAAALLVGAVASAQRLSVATNVLDYADFGGTIYLFTLND